jgi:hypothetical protein
MSNASQREFLLKLQKELLSVSGASANAEQRALFNTRGHVFTITSRALKRGLREGVAKAYAGEAKEGRKFAAKISKASDANILAFISTMTAIYRNQAKKGLVRITTATPRKLVVTVFESGDVFKRVKSAYNDPLNDLFEKINNRAKGILGRRGNLYNLEHGQFVGVLETTVRDTIDNVLNEDVSGNTLASVKKFFESQGVDITVIRNSKTDTMEIFLGSSVSNQAERADSQNKKKLLLDTLDKAIARLQKNPIFAFADLKGSDSFKTKKRKQVVKIITDPFKKIKKSKVTTENIKIKESKTSVKGKVGAKAKLTGKGRKKAVRASMLGTGFSQVRLYAALNTRINTVVAKNMELPGLEYQTGRFASGVKITDVSKTPQGFPSVGYTYQLYPYQTFEPGFAQGSTDRDPRKLIDRSIREIAAEMVTGRLYTRRQ